MICPLYLVAVRTAQKTRGFLSGPHKRACALKKGGWTWTGGGTSNPRPRWVIGNRRASPPIRRSHLSANKLGELTRAWFPGEMCLKAYLLNSGNGYEKRNFAFRDKAYSAEILRRA